ncbi:histidinol-phosphatase HisJ family protein [Herbivorax sp. ANBcel31]|uniref:histidinol-phosphatase HisJ family protein n=1 Tax=Herbivorax sp. ANBcel31 TaxID=3069754 RepID=UPI0027B06C43|nr:histidinol-phosphatase HisJ family protein [Herbivorax sp. ANBcel31]MDQ2085799.1 histidinol-phosphatase HisJ family protein [Herbivorax sp. ANBcel31]
MFDCHIHSSFSGDSEMNCQVAIETAINLGLDGIAFTDHLDYDYPDYDDVFMIDFDKYSLFVDKLKQDNKKNIKIFKGIEVGIQPHVIQDTKEIIEKYDFDIVIASTHIVDKLDLHNGDFCKDKTRKEAYCRYLEAVLESVSGLNNFDVLGHLDLIRRYGCYDVNTLRYKDFSDCIDAILSKLISSGKGLEVNTSGYRYNLGSPMPDFDIVNRYRELGGEIICTSSDAHTPDYIAYKFSYIKELIEKAGFKYIAYFENRKPVFEPIK